MEQTIKKKIWGIEFEEVYSDGYLIWFPVIDNPFYNPATGKYTIGLNKKFLRTAIEKGVNRFRIKVGQVDIPMRPPTEKELRIKDRKKEFEDKKSMFKNGRDMRIYYFEV